MKSYKKKMRVLVKRWVKPLNIRNLILINVLMLAAIKLAVPFYGPQLATIIDQASPFDSRAVITETNKVRAVEGLGPVSANVELDLAAYEKLNDMIANGYFAHVSPKGVTPWSWMTKVGYKYSYAGENLALGFVSPETTVEAWMNSPSHKENLLNSNYTEIGVATGKANLSGVEGILVVQMFGKPYAQAVAIEQVPLPKVSPIAKKNPQVSPQTASLVSGSEVVNTQVQPANPNQISTDANVSVVAEPLGSINKNILGSATVSGRLNFVYETYLVLSTVLLGMAIAFGAIKKNLIMATATNFALLLMAVVLPSLEVITRNIVF